VHNFKMGTAQDPDAPGANGESVMFDAGAAWGKETGPGGGALAYVPIGGADVASCASGAWAAVDGGQPLTAMPTCSGTDVPEVLQKGLGSIPAGESRSWGVVVLFDADGNATGAHDAWTAFLAGRDAETLLADTLAEWNAWRVPVPGLSDDARRVWRQSEAVLRMGQVLEPYGVSPRRKNHGMILASLPPGGWHSGWVRDATYAIVALARIGHTAEARLALEFFLNADAGQYKSYVGNASYRISTVRYYGDGLEEADYSGQPTPNIELDGWGLVLWAARAYLDSSGDDAWLASATKKGDTVYDALRNGVAEPLIANLESQGMVIAETSIWEVHWGNREHFAYTTAAAARGLCDMAAIARRAGKLDDRDRYAMYAERARTALRTQFADQHGVLAGSIEKLSKGSNYHDGAVLEAITFGLFAPGDATTAATLSDMTYLQTAVGGYKRLEGSSDQYDTDEWVLLDLRAADAFGRAGQAARANALYGFVTAQARVNYDLVPELYNTNASSGALGRYSGSIPMVGYGAGAYMLTTLSRAGVPEHTDCGSEDPATPADGGPMYVDAGPQADGGGQNGLDDSYTGVACLCTVGLDHRGEGAIGGASLVGLGAALLVRRRRLP
jgi:GH15 family glucan-1,4-alpha-glucosidase